MQELQVRIIEIISRTYNVMSFRVGITSEAEFKAGQFLQVILNTEPQLKRYLSISNSPTEKGYLEFTKKITDSDFCRVLKDLKPGDNLTIQYPFGKFTLDENCYKIAFISGGIGITPIRSICKYVVDKQLGTDIALLYANRTVNDIAFKSDFDQMQKQYPKLKVIHVLNEPVAGVDCIGGCINIDVIKDSVPDYAERKLYLCGPPAMVEAMKNILTAELGFGEGNIITENFQGY